MAGLHRLTVDGSRLDADLDSADDPTHLDAKVKKLAKIAAKHGVTEVFRQDGADAGGRKRRARALRCEH